MATATKPKRKRAGDNYSPEERQRWREERLSEQKQLLEDALTALTSSESWASWIKFGRNNLKRLSFTNAMLIWSQNREATIVWGRKQWAKQGVTVESGAKPLRYFAPSGFFTPKDGAGNPLLDANGNEIKRMMFRIVQGFDITDTDAPPSDFDPMVELEGDELEDMLPELEVWARELGYGVQHVSESVLGNAHGRVNDRLWNIEILDRLAPNAKVLTLVHELFHVFGNVNYKDYSRQEAEVIVESSTVMALGMVGFDVSEASVPYIASWAQDTKLIEKFAKLVDTLVIEFAKRVGL